MCAELLRRYAWQGGILNHLYCRYNAALDGKDCVKCKCKISVYPYAMPLALRRQELPPSLKLRRIAMEGFLRTLRLRLRLFLQAKKSTDSSPCNLNSVCFGTRGGFSPPSLCELWRASFARFVSLRLFLQAKKKSTDSKPCGLPSVALAKDGGGCFNSSEYFSQAQNGCRQCNFAEPFHFFGKHL